jgi:hypothetical protein
MSTLGGFARRLLAAVRPRRQARQTMSIDDRKVRLGGITSPDSACAIGRNRWVGDGGIHFAHERCRDVL